MASDVLENDPSPDGIAVLVIDDHALFREGIVNYLRTQPGLRVSAALSSGAQAIEELSRTRADVVLLDLRLGTANGLDVLVQIKAEPNAPKVLIVSSHEGDAMVRRAIACGADGYVSKSVSSAELVAAIRRVQGGRCAISPDIANKMAYTLNEPALTEREIKILEHIAAGLSNKEVGAKLGVSEKTIKNRLISMFLKLNASDRTHAVVIAMERGFISPPR